ncbi:MAG: universal stress protein [Acidobacteria bacterium]|jgi:nucleotide-binding universal stress UspA family protein|nr:universal stress protein [Acidobacteriota bacterium]
MRYIVATDGSHASLKAAGFFVQHLCPGAEDEIFVIYVFPLPSDPECYEGVVALPREASDARIVEAARPILKRTKTVLAGAKCPIHDVVLVGNPARELVVFAMNLGVDLIVAGTRGRSPEQELYLGSVSSGLTHRAPCSVLVVR